MADDIYDKLQIDSSIKLTFPGIDIKEIKQTKSFPVPETARKRVQILATDPDALVATLVDGGFPALEKTRAFVLIVVKLAKLDQNKGIQPVLVGNTAFHPANPDHSSKLEGDGSVAFWKDGPEKFKITDGKWPVYVFNPNSTPVVLEIAYGTDDPPPSKPAPAGGGTTPAGGGTTQYGGGPAQHGGGPTQHGGGPAQHSGGPAQHGGGPAQHAG
jgi:hypothetical protein